VVSVHVHDLENHSSEAEYAAGLLYAEDSDWVEVSATPDMQPHGGQSLKSLKAPQV
jgi:hypothetical protein